MSLRRYRHLVAITTLLLGLIVLSGATVRLTKAGLGCTEWPECHDGQLLPADEDLLGKIEYGNRVFSGIIGLFTLAVVIGAWRLRRHRPDLLPWAAGLVAGSVAQVLLGRAVVELQLDPIAVAGHFLLSAVMLWNAVVLWLKVGSTSNRPVPRVRRRLITHSRITVGLISVVLILGTLVTGTGPNSGDSRAERLGLEFSTIARTHSVAAWLFLAAALGLIVGLRREPIERLPSPNLDPVRLGHWLMAVTAAQGAVGYWQYLTGVPPLLVGFHVAGSVVVWSLALLIHLSLFARRPATDVSRQEESAIESVDVAAGVVVDVEPV